jgi:hypothetical protein
MRGRLILALALVLPAWQPLRAAGPDEAIVPDAPVLRLDELGLYRIGYAYTGQPERELPVGWSGEFDDATGVTYREVGIQDGRAACLMHAPWRGGTGQAFQEYRVALPRGVRIALSGATAMRSDALGADRSDGVTFRVRVDGEALLEVHRVDARWEAFSFDLTPMAGRVVTIRFEVDPGPRGNASYDFALWGDRALVLEGFRPAAIRLTEPPPLDLAALGARHAGATGVEPASGSEGVVTMRSDGAAREWRHEGPDGTLVYRCELPRTGDDRVLGRWSLTATTAGGESAEVPLLRAPRLEWTGAAALKASAWETDTSGGAVLARTFEVEGRGLVTLRVRPGLREKTLALAITCDQPALRALDPGPWGPVLRRLAVPVPFYSGQVHHLPAEGVFVNALLDWTASDATRHQGTRAAYDALTDGSRATLRETALFTAAWHVDEVLPRIPNRPSPFRAELAGRVVFDVWGGSYDRIAHELETLADHGIRDGLVIVHNWQRDGYDNALPAHYPAAADKGGDEAMQRLVATGRRLGHFMALHENYVDYYPNYERYDEADIALDPEGKLQQAWYNPGTGVQSFAVKPNAILRLAAEQSPEIHRRYGTNACYLDVHSAVPPWFHVDQRAGEAGAGRFSRVFDVHRELFAYERQTHAGEVVDSGGQARRPAGGGPVLGEGNNHWYWSGLLDGAEAQLGSGWPTNQGRSVPLMVDFDLLAIHSLQANHGMGYYQRWWPESETSAWAPVPPMSVLDQYRLQTLAFGHQPFLSGEWARVPLAWQEQHLAAPVAARFATARVRAIAYEVDGRWVDTTTAARTGRFDRVRVVYDNGLTFTGNQADAALEVDGQRLPRYGWIARGAGIEAGTTEREGVVTDFCDTGDAVFANARPARDWNLDGVTRVRPRVAEFVAEGPRTIRFTYQWEVGERLDADYTAFVHFGQVGEGETRDGILFQQDHATAPRSTEWTVGQVVTDGPHRLTIPEGLADGDYTWRIGLFRPGGRRLVLEGPTDATGRVSLGVIRVVDGGRTVQYVPEAEQASARRAVYAEHLNPENRVIDFGPIATDGSVSLRREGMEWVLRTWPREVAFQVHLDARRFPAPEWIACERGGADVVTPISTGARWSLPLNGAAAYRWPAGEEQRE